MVNPVIEAVVALALSDLRWALRVRPRWWQKRKWKERHNAICDYLIVVCGIHLEQMLLEDPLPDDEGSERRLTEAIEHALRAANDPEVAKVAPAMDGPLADYWRARYKNEIARRRTSPWGVPSGFLPASDYQAREEQREQAAENHGREGQTSQAMPDEATDEERQRLIEYRKRLLDEYKAATGASERAIYNASGSGGHTCRKADFYAWRKGELPASSSMAQSLERFLQAKRPPPKSKSSVKLTPTSGSQYKS